MKENIILYAFRYCLGRQSYAVSEMVEYLLENWKNISEQTKEKIKHEIECAIRSNEAGANIDVKEWKKILSK